MSNHAELISIADELSETDPALRIFLLMLRQVWEKQFVNGEFVSIEDDP